MIKDALIVDADMQTSAPESVDAQLAAAKALYQGNEPAHAEAVLRTVFDRETSREAVAMLLAEIQRSQGHLSAASETLLAVSRANGFEPGLSLRCAAFVRQCDRHAIAAQICAGALAHAPASADLLMLAANVAREAGDFTNARARYLAALDAGLDLERHHALAALANTRRYVDPTDPDIERFAKHFADAAYSARSRTSAGFALAKAHDDLADYASAARILREANSMCRATHPWDAAAWRNAVDARRREHVVAASAARDTHFNPLFIVGVPRSGTTLTATLLARATGARDRGELRALRYIADQLADGGHLDNASALAEAAGVYRRLAVQDDAPATWYLDQDPLNFRYLHIVAAMFPQARVIHLRRELRDTALSLWSQDFAHPDLAFAYAFDDMRAFMEGHAALMQRWHETLSVPIFELDYETLVREPDATVARLADFIGAPLLGVETGDIAAPVQSASVWQARQPVYSTSVGRWKRYAPLVPELERFCGPA